MPVARPPLLMVAIEVALEVQVAEEVRFCLLPLLKVPVAVNCCWFPAAIDGLTGVTAIDTSTGAVTVNPVEPLMEPEVAWMVVLPAATPVAKPALLMVATEVADEIHVADEVR